MNATVTAMTGILKDLAGGEDRSTTQTTWGKLAGVLLCREIVA